MGKLLGFPYPGGPVIDRLAPYGDPKAVQFTSAKMKGNPLDFSFSGLKTAVLRWTEKQAGMAEEVELRKRNTDYSIEGWLRVTSRRTLDLLASFQRTVIDELLWRAVASAEQIGAESVIVAGGVACNRGLQERTQSMNGPAFYFPSPGLSTDNAAMIAAAAFPKYERRQFAGFDLKAQASLMLA